MKPQMDSPAAAWDRDATKRAIDELFSLSRQYRASRAYADLLRFAGRFRFYSPFNAMLLHIQMPGARFVAPAGRWLRDCNRRIRPGARPLVILRPMGPIMFVFDVSDTEPGDGESYLPPEVEQPFDTTGGQIDNELAVAIENAKRDGVRVTGQTSGSQSAGSIGVVDRGGHQKVPIHFRPKQKYVKVPIRYEVLLNEDHPGEVKFASLAHELAHLYCGHLGTPNSRWWPDRRGLPAEVREFESESVCYLICRRIGIDNPSARYLAGYIRTHDETPPVSLDSIMKTAGLIERMSRERLKARKGKTK